MRRLLALAALLFASSLTLTQCGSAAGGDQSTLKAVATTNQVMDAIVIPNSQALWDAVVYDNGQIERAPKTDDDWYNLQMNAWAVAEAGNLLMMAPRAKDNGDWMTLSAAMTERSVAAVKAAEAKDVQGLLKAGGELYTACTDCHRKYLVETEGF
jgi:hypothetical protein